MRVLLAAAAVAALAACAPEDQASLAEQAEDAAAEAPASLADTRSLSAPPSPADNLAAAEAYLAENGARAGVVTTPTGLQYEVLAAGPAEGVSPALGQWVCVHYRGTFIDGAEFDSSYSRNQAIAFPSNGVISGWVEALSMMKPGDAWRLAIHPNLAYGPMGRPSIPPNSALLFDVELLKLLDGEPPRGTDCAAG